MIKRGYADTPEGQVHYRADGEGEPLILLHQSPRSSRMYVDLIPLLAEHYRTIAVDMLGYGNSDPPPPGGQVADLAMNIIHVLDSFQIEKCHVFGLHTGSGIAAEMAAEWPERIATLSLFGYPLIENEGEREAYFAIREKGALPREFSNDGSHLTRLWMRAYSEVGRLWLHTAHPPSEALYPSPLRSVHDCMTDEHVRFLDRWIVDFLQTKDYVGQITKSLFMYDSLSRLPLIQAPTLHIEPDSPYENYFCMRGARMAKLIPGCESVIMPASDDNAAEFKAEELANMLLNFLRKHDVS